MPEQNTKLDEKKSEEKPVFEKKEGEKKDATLDKIVARVKDAENILIALSDNPTVDEMAAAIGLAMVLDLIGKHATAIYSGKTPNVLEFLNPQATFETNTNSLQDFIIALNKEKADHLRYKVDGDFVKVYITPYRTTISEDDLEFSRGDFNVDLVIALNVAAATDLDGALKEHGRIMHDASAINITTGAPGKFGEVEWVNPEASSISEMVTNLALKLSKDLDQASATALLTGLVAATDRFSNEQTTPAAMVLAATLMKAGADQQLVAANVSGQLNVSGGGNENGVEEGGEISVPKKEEDASLFDVRHGDSSKEASEEEGKEVEAETGQANVGTESSEAENENKEEGKAEELPKISPLGGGGAAATPEPEPGELTVPTVEDFKGVNPAPVEAAEPNVIAGVEIGPTGGTVGGVNPGNLADSMVAQITGAQETKDYGKMIDEALSEPLPGEGGIQIGANGPNGVVENTQDVEAVEGAAPVAQGADEVNSVAGNSAMTNNPATGMAPEVGNAPVVNNIPPMSYGGGSEDFINRQPEKVLDPANAQEMFSPVGDLGKELEKAAMEPVPVPSDLPMPGQEILPPPPAPPVDFSMNAPVQAEMPPVPEMPQVQVPNMGGNPEIAEVGNNPSVVQPDNSGNPGAFQIPGM